MGKSKFLQIQEAQRLRDTAHAAQSPKKPESHAISDKSKLIWERFYNPMQSAAMTLNAAIRAAQDVIAAQIMEAEGYSTDEWQFDIENLKIVKRQG